MVTTEVKALSSCKREMKITVPTEDIDSIRQEQIKLVQKQAQVQGFRKGKAPRHMVIQQYSGTIEKNTIDEAMQFGFEEGLKQNKIIPVGEPQRRDRNAEDQGQQSERLKHDRQDLHSRFALHRHTI